MLSLKRYLNAAFAHASLAGHSPSSACPRLLAAYRSALAQIGECGADICPTDGAELKRGIAKIDASLCGSAGLEIAAIERSVSELLHTWRNRAALHSQQRTVELKDLLLIMSRTAESLAHNDRRYGQQLDYVTAKMEGIATLDDVSEIRASLEESARDLRKTVNRMTAESKAVIDHLRAEVSAYQARLEEADSVACRDILTGLGNQRWMEDSIEQRLASGLRFSILLVDIDAFRRVNDEFGKQVGDELLKEFARELRSACRFSDLVARFAGDRFVVLLDCTGSDAQAQAARLQASMSKCYKLAGRSRYRGVTVQMEVSIGLADYRKGDGRTDVLERAHAELMKGRSMARERLTA